MNYSAHQRICSDPFDLALAPSHSLFIAGHVFKDKSFLSSPSHSIFTILQWSSVLVAAASAQQPEAV